jgi:hypothetical protein
VKQLQRACLAGVFFFLLPGAALADPVSIAVPTLDPAPATAGTIDTTWAAAAKLDLTYDFTYRRAASEPTHVYVAQDKTGFDVAFVATQHEALTQLAETNGSSVLNDDYVGFYLYPDGVKGFQYGFFANPRGARYQFSSENSAYAPTWTAVGKRTTDGYIVTMHIPLDAIRRSGTSAWKVQFVRSTVATNGLAEWTYASEQRGVTDQIYAGTLTGIGVTHTAATRPKPRAQIYALGEATPVSNGGDTSRIGADFSIPVTPTASFVATLHPDYSNVEIDQQSISPTAFARQYSEVRPFFTQAAQQFNVHLSCTNCPTLLYTPAIPTFREGYAVEGSQGAFTFGAFDALGEGRSDEAQSLNWTLQNAKEVVQVATQRVAVDTTTGIHDDVTAVSAGYFDQHTHVYEYVNEAQERGSLVTQSNLADYLEAGVGSAAPTQGYGVSYQRIGAQFSPIDGYVAQSDIEGLEYYYSRTINLSPTATLRDVSASYFGNDQHDRFGAPAQHNDSESVRFDFRNLTSVQFFAGYSAVKTADGEYLPFDGNGFNLGYRLNTSTPTYIQYTGGPYYHGTLQAWTYSTSRQLTHNVRLSLETDEDQYSSIFPGETRAVTWLERAGVNVQLNHDASFDLGVRRIFGTPIPNSYALPTFSPLGNNGNISAAFHYLRGANELYFVYGDPNSLSTTPALYLKWIRYIGAQKGT